MVIQDGITYVPYGWECLGESPDNGQMLIKAECCTSSDCRIFINNVPMAPKLLQDDNGFYYCPRHNEAVVARIRRKSLQRDGNGSTIDGSLVLTKPPNPQ